MTNRVTQCPKCMTSFRVTEVQLNIADGAVRCGSCLHIFHAPGHWLDDNVDKENTANNDLAFQKTDSSPDNKASIAQANSSDDEKVFTDTVEHPAFEETFDSELRDFGAVLDDFSDDLAFTEPVKNVSEEIDREALFSVENDVKLPQSAPVNSEEKDLSPEALTFDEDMLKQAMSGIGLFNDRAFNDSASEGNILDDNIFPDNESIDQQLAESTFGTDGLDNDNESHDHPSDNDLYNDVFSELEDPAMPSTPSPPSVSQQAHEIIGNNEEAGERWAESLAIEPEVDSYKPVNTDKFPDSDLAEEITSDPDLSELQNEHHNPNFTPAPPTREEESLHNEHIVAGDRIGHNSNRLLSNIEPEPVEIATQKTTSQWLNRCWMASIVLALSLLLTQYVFFNLDRFARNNSIRPALTSICNLAGCSVPSLTNIRLIKSSNLVIRSHPKIAHALIVDAIITNRADFAQDFPVIELQFTDLNENIIASRRFSPEEYVRGELTGNKLIPSKQPIYISLEIVDPGLEAVSYQMLIHSRN